jgi:putative Holliday junction resolvase
MRAMGLDLGDRRVGIAISDETGTVAQGHGVYVRRTLEEDLAYLSRLAEELCVRRIVVGLPLHLNGTEGEQAAKARAFAEKLFQRTGLPLSLMDERLTTQEAERVLSLRGVRGQKRKGIRDELAAVLILQAWLDMTRRLGDPSSPAI